MTKFNSIGRPTPLRDGRARVTGALKYLPDISLPGMLHARFVTSIYPHAQINGIDSAAAKEVPGVVAVLTASNLPEVSPRQRHLLLLARDRVIFSGQPVALVLGTSEAAAEDGAALVSVDYQPLPAAITIQEAVAENAPLVWPLGLPGASEEAAAHGADLGSDEVAQKPSNIAHRDIFSRGDIEVG